MSATGSGAGGLAGVIARHGARLLALPGVIGTGEGEDRGQACLVVYVSSHAADVQSLPAAIEGYPVVIRRVEPFKAQPAP